MNRALKVLVTGRFYEHSPRGLTLRQGLEALGHHVDCVRIEVDEKYFIQRKLNKRLNAYSKEIDIILLADLGQELMPAVKKYAEKRGVPVVLDFFFSFYESYVFDRQIMKQGSSKANKFYEIDKQSLELSDAVYFDTKQHQEYARDTFGFHDKLQTIIPIGCPQHFFDDVNKPVALDGSRKFNVLFWGSYIPLQGIQYIVRAAREIQDVDEDIMFFLIGKKGQTYIEMVALAKESGCHNITFIDKINQKDLIKHIMASQCSLGIFGDTDKTDRVVPHKVYEALALGMPTITKATKAMSDLVDDKSYIAVEPSKLSEAILTLKSDDKRSRALSQYAKMWSQNNASPIQCGKKLENLMCQVLEKHASK